MKEKEEKVNASLTKTLNGLKKKNVGRRLVKRKSRGISKISNKNSNSIPIG
jgi:hypothetical protein